MITNNLSALGKQRMINNEEVICCGKHRVSDDEEVIRRVRTRFFDFKISHCSLVLTIILSVEIIGSMIMNK